MLAVGKAIPPIGLILMTHMSVMLADPHPKTPKIEALGAEVTAAIPPIETGMPVVEEVDVLGMAPQETATTPVQVEPTPPEKPSTAAPVQEEPVEVPVEIEESPVVTDEEVSLVEELPESVPTLSTDGGKHETPGEGEEIPKRILKTLQFLTECREKQAEATPEGLAEAIGVSRDTARRYLREAQTFESEEDEHENHEDQEN